MTEKKAGAVRFIRVRGKIVPIRQSEGQLRSSARKGAAAAGIAYGAAVTGLAEGIIADHRGKVSKLSGNADDVAKFAKHSSRSMKFAAIAGVATLGALTYSAVKANKANKISEAGFWKREGHGLANLGIVLSGIGGAVLSYKGLRRAGLAARPGAKKIGEFLKFIRAKKVASEVIPPPQKLLGILK